MSLVSDQDIVQFRTQGYFVTDVVFETEPLNTMANEMDRVYKAGVAESKQTGDPKAIQAATGRRSYSQFHTRSAVAAEFVKSSIYIEACRKLIGPDADLYYNQAAVKPPTLGKVFNWHQDSGYTETEPLEYITCWTAISDSNLENGCIWVIPGSHKLGVLEHLRQEEDRTNYSGVTAQLAQEDGAIPVEMEAGQVAVFSSLMLHKSGPNTTKDRTRYGFVPQYHVPGVILKRSGKPTGDRIPVVRDGKAI